MTEEEIGHRLRLSERGLIKALRSKPTVWSVVLSPCLSGLQAHPSVRIRMEDDIPIKREDFGRRRCPDICTIELYVCSYDSR